MGDIVQFEREFVLDVAVIRYAIKHFGLPENLKLSMHSGSDKFSICEKIASRFDKSGNLGKEPSLDPFETALQIRN